MPSEYKNLEINMNNNGLEAGIDDQQDTELNQGATLKKLIQVGLEKIGKYFLNRYIS